MLRAKNYLLTAYRDRSKFSCTSAFAETNHRVKVCL